MKYETQIDGVKGTLSLEAGTVRYSRDGGGAVTAEYSCTAAGDGCYLVLLNGRSYRVIPLGGNEISVNGGTLQAELLDPRDFRGRRGTAAEGGRKSIKAMMPGKVVRVLVEVGQRVDVGQGLIVVEAMKMQNEMKAPSAGTVTQIKTQNGATLSAGDSLMVIEA